MDMPGKTYKGWVWPKELGGDGRTAYSTPPPGYKKWYPDDGEWYGPKGGYFRMGSSYGNKPFYKDPAARAAGGGGRRNVGGGGSHGGGGRGMSESESFPKLNDPGLGWGISRGESQARQRWRMNQPGFGSPNARPKNGTTITVDPGIGPGGPEIGLNIDLTADNPLKVDWKKSVTESVKKGTKNYFDNRQRRHARQRANERKPKPSGPAGPGNERRAHGEGSQDDQGGDSNPGNTQPVPRRPGGRGGRGGSGRGSRGHTGHQGESGPRGITQVMSPADGYEQYTAAELASMNIGGVMTASPGMSQATDQNNADIQNGQADSNFYSAQANDQQMAALGGPFTGSPGMSMMESDQGMA